jgi:pimeloyl-ACP methyl ester carboxylesterase
VALAVGAGAAVAGAGVAVALANRRWRVDDDGLAAAGRTLPDDVVDRFVTVDDGGRIHAVERGSGPPLVLVHGVTLGVATWVPQLRGLAHGHRVIAIGQRGHGRSLAGEDGYSMERLADDLLCVLESLEVTGAVLVGHSMGGMVAQLLAVRRPEELRRHVAGLVLVATSAGPLVPGPGGGRLVGALAAGAERGLRRAERRGRGLLPHEDVGPLFTRVSFGADPSPADVELTRSMVAAMSPSAVSGLLPPLLSFDVHRRIGAIDLPTWVVVGTRDVLTPPRMARAMAAAIPGARLVVLPGCGHMVMLERADELDALLDRVSAEVAPAR